MTAQGLSLRSKLAAMTIATILALIALIAVVLINSRDELLNDRKEKVRNLVETAHSQIAAYDQQVKAGKLELGAAQQLAMESLRHARYDDKEYFWINDYHPKMVMHPIKPELQGQDLTDNKDANGKRHFVEFVNVVKNGGAGYVDYVWSKPGMESPQPKLSYVKGFEPWGWIIGTGIYIDDVDAAFKKDALLLGSLSAVVLFVLILLGYLVRTSIVRQLGGEPNEAAAIMHQVAAGDLTASVSNAPSDSLLGALDNMVRTLRGLIGEINSGANQLVDNAEQIKHASEEVAIAAERQADATSAMAAAIEELTVSSNHISDSARETEHDSHEAMSLAAQGSERVEEATLAIKNIASTATEVSARIHALEERATQVSSIANVIKDIAGQTNLLALNAAIEAARAGEQGRGFAVVADEVRKLAERTSLATTEIEQMISGIQGETVDAVSAMNTALPEVERGVELAAYASDSLRSIEAGAHRTLDRVGEVASATREQSAASTSIAQRVEDIAQMVDQTTATIRGTADSAGHLECIALNLKQQISRFKI